MKRGVVLVVASTTWLATMGPLHAAEPTTGSSPATTTTAAKPKRVVVAGPQDDSIAPRVQKELTALGFETVRAGALDGCARTAVVLATADANAIAAACSDGDQVGVWVSDGSTLRLRDVVVAREEGERARETTAVRAAEITRANIALAEEEAARAASLPSTRTDGSSVPPPSQEPNKWEPYDKSTSPKPSKAPPSGPTHRAPTFAGSIGASSLLGVDASVGSFSTQVEVGISRNVAVAARLEYPLETTTIPNASNVRVAPAFSGAGIELPLAATTAFIVPRVAGGFGIAWINAERPAGLNRSGTRSTRGDDSVAAPALWGNAGLSMRIVGPFRIVVDGIIGATTSRLVVRDQGTHIAYWGQPFGALSLRVEMMFQ